MQFHPKAYQLIAIAATIRKRFLALFLDPGLGKTSIILRAYLTLKKQRKTTGLLVIAPLRVCYSVWPKEVKKWTFSRHMKVRILHGFNKTWQLSQPADIYVINPEGLNWLFNVALKGKRNYPFDMLVVDESSRFKAHDSVRLKILYKRLLKYRRRYILNGTPAPRGYVDLFGQFLIVDRGVALGRYITHYRKDYLESDYMGYNWTVRNKKCARRIQKKIAPISLVMEAKDHLDMPPLSFPIRWVEMGAKAYRHYHEAQRELFTEILTSERKIVELDLKNIAVATGMCRQLCGGAFYEPLSLEERERPPASKDRVWHELHDRKIESLLDLIDELQGKPLLVAYEFHHSLERIQKALKARKIKAPVINSYTTPGRGVAIENQWNAGKLQVLICQSESIRFGLNLQESGDDLVWFDLTWSLDTFIQLVRRLHRQGKTRAVRVHQICVRGTIERLMLRRIQDKHIVEQDLKQQLRRFRLKHLQKHGN
jgi:SNF2 family DNA or RNA helicase